MSETPEDALVAALATIRADPSLSIGKVASDFAIPRETLR